MAKPQDQFFVELAVELSAKQIIFVRQWIEQITCKHGADIPLRVEKGS